MALTRWSSLWISALRGPSSKKTKNSWLLIGLTSRRSSKRSTNWKLTPMTRDILSWRTKKLKRSKQNLGRSGSKLCFWAICLRCTKKQSRRGSCRLMRRREKKFFCKSKLSKLGMSPNESNKSYNKLLKITMSFMPKLKNFWGSAMTKRRLRSFWRSLMRQMRRDSNWFFNMPKLRNEK